MCSTMSMSACNYKLMFERWKIDIGRCLVYISTQACRWQLAACTTEHLGSSFKLQDQWWWYIQQLWNINLPLVRDHTHNVTHRDWNVTLTVYFGPYCSRSDLSSNQLLKRSHFNFGVLAATDKTPQAATCCPGLFPCAQAAFCRRWQPVTVPDAAFHYVRTSIRSHKWWKKHHDVVRCELIQVPRRIVRKMLSYSWSSNSRISIPLAGDNEETLSRIWCRAMWVRSSCLSITYWLSFMFSYIWENL